MITFSIEDATIASLLYLLILISSVIMIALVYLIVLMRENNEKIFQLTSRYMCDSVANGLSAFRSGVSKENVLSSLERLRGSNEYVKGAGGMVYPPNFEFCKCGKVKSVKESCTCNETECQGGKGYAAGDVVKGNDLANV